MSLQSVMQQFRAEVQGLRPAAGEGDLARLRKSCGPLPEQVITLYQDHDGSDQYPAIPRKTLPLRLMPIAEVLKTREQMAPYEKRMAKVGPIAWFWTDDNSNYAGVYLDGLLAGWVCVLDHEEPLLVPSFRYVESFMVHLLADLRGVHGKNRFCDLPSLRREYPKSAPDAAHDDQDWVFSEIFRKQWTDEADAELAQLFAMCGICLTPFEKTSEASVFLDVDDMWIPAAAVRLLAIRRWRGGVEQLERLARDGHPNGDGAAIGLLARMNTNESRNAVTRLRRTLTGQKLQILEMCARGPLRPPRC